MDRRLPSAGVLVLFLLYTSASVRQAAVWTNELTLWLHAVERAPDKPRPHINLALALMERQRFAEAAAVLDDTDRILKTCTLPPWDRIETARALQQNRLLLARLSGAGPRVAGRRSW